MFIYLFISPLKDINGVMEIPSSGEFWYYMLPYGWVSAGKDQTENFALSLGHAAESLSAFYVWHISTTLLNNIYK